MERTNRHTKIVTLGITVWVRPDPKERAVSESTTEMTGVMIGPVTGEIDQKELAKRLLAQAKSKA